MDSVTLFWGAATMTVGGLIVKDFSWFGIALGLMWMGFAVRNYRK